MSHDARVSDNTVAGVPPYAPEHYWAWRHQWRPGCEDARIPEERIPDLPDERLIWPPLPPPGPDWRITK